MKKMLERLDKYVEDINKCNRNLVIAELAALTAKIQNLSVD